MASVVCMDTVYALASADDVVTTKPTMAKPETKRRRTNIFRTALAPVSLSLKILGMGENDFGFRFFRYAYNFYFLIVLVLSAGTVYNTYLNTLITAFRAASISNLIDQYAWWSAELVWLYTLATVMVFLVWGLKWKKVSEMTRLLDEEHFDFIHKLEDERDPFFQRRIRIVTIKSYLACAFFILETLAWPVLLYSLRGLKRTIILYSLAVVPTLVISATLAMAFTIYVCTAEVWNIYNYSLKKEGQRAGVSGSDLEVIVKKYSDRYDAVSNLTATVAHLFRYFAIVHIGVVLNLITLVYQTLFDPTLWIPFKVYYWFDVAVGLTPLFAAATVSGRSLGTAVTLHGVYKDYVGSFGKTRGAAASEMRKHQPSAAYKYFYQRVANEDMCVSLDIAGTLSITKATVLAMLFAAINWCAVIMQFRQGSGGPLDSRSAVNGTNTTSLS